MTEVMETEVIDGSGAAAVLLTTVRGRLTVQLSLRNRPPKSRLLRGRFRSTNAGPMPPLADPQQYYLYPGRVVVLSRRGDI